MPPTAIRTPEVVEAVVQRFRTVWTEPGGATFGLKVIQAGGLSKLAADENYLNNLPALIGVPDRAGEIQLASAGGEVFRIVHFVRLLYARKFDPSGTTEKALWTDLDKIAQTYLDDLSLGGAALTGATIDFANAVAIEHYPPEQDVLAQLGRADILLGAVVVRIQTWTQRV
jgi:hypothetical protein